ncbi:alpha/beta fold hydrolase [Caballeronia sp. SBC2]|uniref:alpha/beta fold hydrolase n=1 Tax=Caballeronia sp. SBC2 TaxID=2705547 RepID=UPI0013E1BD51|nr:alpha/beta hydrolase [Caballeronia sp. SBC2]QIE24974.1 putative hydrolase [Caballeronia sp. SBC2]
MKTSATIHTEGADIAYDVEGQGPLLLLVVGGNGDSRRFTRLSAQLADRYTVIRYDRRANFRSTGDTQIEMDMAQQGRDAAAIIRARGTEPAYVFGNSAGANIALKLTQDHPQLVRGLVDHEPPITDFLPETEATPWRKFFTRVYDTYKTKGGAEAMKLFNTSFVGLDLNASVPGDQGSEFERFLAHEFNIINSFVPDLDALRRGGVPMVTARGQASSNAFYAQTARELARQLPCPCIEMSGHHLSYATDPVVFANELNQILNSLPARHASLS